ncbi:MAG: hypothetical protein IKT00_01975 [Prevotella sp.]|nr:hypothetical protein [Prevotella sp.]
MKKEYLEPQSKTFLFSPSLMDDNEQTSTTVHTDDPQDPGGALGNSTNAWEDYNSNAPVNPNVWDNE